MKKILFAMIAGVAAMSAAQAQNATPGPYIGLGVTTANYDFHAPSGVTNAKTDDPKAAAKIFGGYEFNPTWGIEAGYSSLGKSDYSGSVGPFNGTERVEGNRAYIAAKATKPINEAFSIYGKLGAGHTRAKITSGAFAGERNDSKTEAYGALGAQYNINQKVALTLEYERFGKNKDFGPSANAVSVNARYSF